MQPYSIDDSSYQVCDDQNRRSDEQYQYPVVEAQPFHIEYRAGKCHDQNLSQHNDKGDPYEAFAE